MGYVLECFEVFGSQKGHSNPKKRMLFQKKLAKGKGDPRGTPLRPIG
jgi:hypothetical protein